MLYLLINLATADKVNKLYLFLYIARDLMIDASQANHG